MAKSFVATFLILVLLLPLWAQRPRGRQPQAKPSRPAVKKTASPHRRQQQSPPSRVAEVWVRCTSDSKHIVFNVYFQRVFRQSVRVERVTEEQTQAEYGNWVAVDGWDQLVDGILIRELMEEFQPEILEVYPGIKSWNTAMINAVVLIRQQPWSLAEVRQAEPILRRHIDQLGFTSNYNLAECILPEVVEKPPVLRIFQ